MGIKITDKKTNHGKKLEKQVKDLKKKPVVKVGVTQKEGVKDHGAITVAEIATYHEFGLGVPKRPFISQPVDKFKKAYFDIIQNLKLEIVLGKMTIEKGLDLLGLKIMTDQKNMITDKQYKQLHPSTIEARKAKGLNAENPTPLVDTGQLINSLTWEVVK